jgi:hypothetical protein
VTRGLRGTAPAVMIGLVAAGCGVEPQPTSDPTGFIFVLDELGAIATLEP